MASTSYSNTAPDDEEEDKVVVECREPEEEQNEATTGLSEITISTADIPSWNLSAILSHDIVKVKASRNRFIQQSSYFRGLLSGSFSESSKKCVIIRWSLRTFLEVLRFMYGAPIKIRRCNVLPLFQAALYFGAEIVLSECRTWISDNFSHNAVVSTQIQLDELILFWNFGIELGVDLITWHCISYMARNFMCAMACDSFIDVPYNLLLSCIKHPDLTVNSERHLAEALLSWIYAHADKPKHDESSKIDWTNIFKQIRVYILPLWFLMGKLRCQYLSEFIEQSIDVIFSQCQQSSIFFKDVHGTSSLSSCSVRITEFTKKLDLSGCPQINKTNFYLLPFRNCVLKDGPMPTSIDLKCLSCHDLGQILSFKSVVELDISKCPNLRPVDLLEFLSKLFPSLRNLKVAYFSGLETRHLQKLMECHPSLDEVDLRVDIGPIIPLETPILYSEVESIHPPTMYFGRADPLFKQPLSALTKLTLRGRTDVNDLNLLDISECFASLCYLDIKGCFSVTDAGISHCISRCANLHSFIASDTRFGKYSTSALLENSRAEFYTINLQLLHIGGCKGVDEASLLAILSQAHNLTSLCLRDTCLIDNALCNFTGSSLEKLNVSNTGVSWHVLDQEFELWL